MVKPNLLKGGDIIPILQHLLEELRRLDINPAEIRLPAALYDDLVAQSEV